MPIGCERFCDAREHRAVYSEIGALALGRAQFFDGVARHADQEPGGRDPANRIGRHRSGGQMNTVRAAGQRDIGARVDQRSGCFVQLAGRARTKPLSSRAESSLARI